VLLGNDIKIPNISLSVYEQLGNSFVSGACGKNENVESQHLQVNMFNKNETQIKKDKQRKLGISGHPFSQCDVEGCGKLYAEKWQREQLKIHHKSVHDQVKDYHYDESEYSSSFKQGLGKHKAHVHYKIKNYRCKQRTSRFNSKAHLERHINTVHDRIKDQQCDDCGKCFSTKKILK
jgi:hypothetical protein